jgi:exodeoxyribonuclease VII small subunit
MNRLSSKSTNAESLESIMNSLETLTKILESDETSLTDSMQAFEKGVALVRSAQASLNTAEQKVTELLEDSDPVLRPKGDGQ